MKYSRIAMLIWLGIIALTLIAILGTGRAMIGKPVDNGNTSKINFRSIPESDWVTDNQDLPEIRGILLEGAWNMRIEKGDRNSMSITSPGTDYWDSRVENGILNLSSQMDRDRKGYHVDLVLSDLSELIVEGAVDLDLQGFTLDNFHIRNEGAGNMTARDSSMKYLQVENDGALNLNFKESPVRNAVVEMNGAGNIELFMDGGILDVTINGMGGVKYKGEVTDVRSNINGLGRVSEID